MQAKCPFRAGIWMRSLLLMGLPRWLSGKELTYRCRSCKRRGLDPWVGKLPGGGNGYPLQYSFLENPMDRGVWSATVHGVVKRWISLSNWACMPTNVVVGDTRRFYSQPAGFKPEWLLLASVPSSVKWGCESTYWLLGWGCWEDEKQDSVYRLLRTIPGTFY